jgi:uncharacterized protein YbaA (DUF1428 family)
MEAIEKYVDGFVIPIPKYKINEYRRIAEKDISAAGGMVETEAVDALDEKAVAKHTDAVVAKAGGIDIALNAVGIMHVQGSH